jgi:DNA polymerase III epsilon subunit-like protein
MEDKQLYLFFDTETTGLPKDYNAPSTDSDNWPRVVQLAFIVMDAEGNVVKKRDYIIKPNGFEIPPETSAIHGITTEIAMEKGLDLEDVLYLFLLAVKKSEFIIGHNVSFDVKVVRAELHRLGFPDIFEDKIKVCTMQSSTKFCELPGLYGFKWPKLQELHKKLFDCEFEEAHNALADIEATAKCYYELVKRGII